MITLHGVFGSPFVRAVRIALEEKQLPWAWAPFPLGAHKERPYLDLHPFGKIPAMVDDGFALYETQAMLRYIDRQSAEHPLAPADPHRLARMDQVLCIVDCYLWPNAARPINFNRFIAPRLGRPVDEQAVADAVPHAETALAAIAALQGDNDYLTGDSFTLADIATLVHLDWLARTPEGEKLYAPHKGLLAWLERVRPRESVQHSNKPPEQVLAA
jgi:glutathione S-transferase